MSHTFLFVFFISTYHVAELSQDPILYNSVRFHGQERQQNLEKILQDSRSEGQDEDFNRQHLQMVSSYVISGHDHIYELIPDPQWWPYEDQTSRYPKSSLEYGLEASSYKNEEYMNFLKRLSHKNKYTIPPPETPQNFFGDANSDMYPNISSCSSALGEEGQHNSPCLQNHVISPNLVEHTHNHVDCVNHHSPCNVLDSNEYLTTHKANYENKQVLNNVSRSLNNHPFKDKIRSALRHQNFNIPRCVGGVSSSDEYVDPTQFQKDQNYATLNLENPSLETMEYCGNLSPSSTKLNSSRKLDSRQMNALSECMSHVPNVSCDHKNCQVCQMKVSKGKYENKETNQSLVPQKRQKKEEKTNSSNSNYPSTMKEAEIFEPLSFISNIQARGKYLAEPLLPREDVDGFFASVEICLLSKLGTLDLSHMVLIKKAVERARCWVCHQFLGSLQLMHQHKQQADLNSNMKGMVPLQDGISLGWEFVKEEISNWKDINFIENGICVFDPLKSWKEYEGVNYNDAFEILRYHMHFNIKEDEYPLEHYLAYMIEKWHRNVLRDNGYKYTPTECIDRLLNLYKKPYCYSQHVHPCLTFVQLQGKNFMGRMTANLQMRGQVILNSLSLNSHVRKFFDGITKRIKSSVTLDYKSKNMIKTTLRRLENWVTHRFIGTLQLIYVHNRKRFPESGWVTLQDRIMKGWKFLENIWHDLDTVILGTHDLFQTPDTMAHKARLRCYDIEKVLKYFMHCKNYSSPPNDYFWYLIGRFFLKDNKPSETNPFFYHNEPKNVVKNCYIYPL